MPAENVLGEENRGFYSIMANFQTERLVIGAMAMAEAREAIRLTFEYVNQRTAFGEPLWDKQAIRQRLSKRLAEVEAARQLVHHTAWLDAQGGDCVAQVSMVKALAGDLVNEVLYDCVQFHGGMGFMRETAGRAHVARRACPGDRRRRLGSHARGNRQALRRGDRRLIAIAAPP